MIPFDDVTEFALSAEPEDAPPPTEPPPVVDPRDLYGLPFLVEGADGGPHTEGPIVVQWHERTFTHDGVHYEHVSEDLTGRWVYRPMP